MCLTFWPPLKIVPPQQWVRRMQNECESGKMQKITFFGKSRGKPWFEGQFWDFCEREISGAGTSYCSRSTHRWISQPLLKPPRSSQYPMSCILSLLSPRWDTGSRFRHIKQLARPLAALGYLLIQHEIGVTYVSVRDLVYVLLQRPQPVLFLYNSIVEYHQPGSHDALIWCIQNKHSTLKGRNKYQ